MTTFTITSATETDAVSLGEARDVVRATLGEYRTFRRTTQSDEADHFVEVGAMATYSPDGALVLLELADPARAVLEGVQLLGEPVDAPIEALAAQGVQVVPDEMGAIIPALEIGLYAPGGVVEGVGIGSDG